MNFKNDMIEAAAEQLALDFSCKASDFLKEESTITAAKQMYGRRIFKEIPDFFRAATFGNGTVLSISPEIYTFATAMISNISPLKIFDAEGIYIINKELEKYRMVLGAFHEYYLPHTPAKPAPPCRYQLEVVEEADISSLYGNSFFQNALLFQTNEERHDVLAVCAKNGNEIIGIAGASNDSPRFWQIGIDVLPKYRHEGVATALTSTLTSEVLMHGAIPYYGTWWSNIASRNTALSCGYYPVWSEMAAVPLD